MININYSPKNTLVNTIFRTRLLKENAIKRTNPNNKLAIILAVNLSLRKDFRYSEKYGDNLIFILFLLIKIKGKTVMIGLWLLISITAYNKSSTIFAKTRIKKVKDVITKKATIMSTSIRIGATNAFTSNPSP